jgi:hypothetical protein
MAMRIVESAMVGVTTFVSCQKASTLHCVRSASTCLYGFQVVAVKACVINTVAVQVRPCKRRLYNRFDTIIVVLCTVCHYPLCFALGCVSTVIFLQA